nr:ATP-binding protein [Pullulanibacillus pueri]
MVLIGYYFLSVLFRSTDEALATIKRFTEGRFTLNTAERWNNSSNPLNDELYRLSEYLQHTKRSFEFQQDQLGALIENLGSPFLFIDRHGTIRLANELFQQTFELKVDPKQERKYDEHLTDPILIRLIKDALTLKTEVHHSLVVPIGIQRYHYDVYCIPIRRGHGHSKGLVVIFHDITRLKKLEKIRKDFVANVSHELRTPVTSLKGFAETLLEDPTIDESERNKFLTIILKESDRLQLLIQDLLELSKIENEHFRLDVEKTDLGVITEETIDLLAEKARRKKIDIDYNKQGLGVVLGDPTRLKQMFVNIINNAIAYSPEGSHIKVLVMEQASEVLFRVSDNGIGIEKSEIPRVFERFYRVDKARSRNSGGTGLGLAIVKHLTEAHEGRIEVESEPGQGTTFNIFLKKYKHK